MPNVNTPTVTSKPGVQDVKVATTVETSKTAGGAPETIGAPDNKNLDTRQEKPTVIAADPSNPIEQLMSSTDAANREASRAAQNRARENRGGPGRVVSGGADTRANSANELYRNRAQRGKRIVLKKSETHFASSLIGSQVVLPNGKVKKFHDGYVSVGNEEDIDSMRKIAASSNGLIREATPEYLSKRGVELK